jgi:hypothetical protein
MLVEGTPVAFYGVPLQVVGPISRNLAPPAPFVRDTVAFKSAIHGGGRSKKGERLPSVNARAI